MDVWHVLPGAVFGVEGLVVVVVAMALARDRGGATHLTVVGTGLATLIAVAGLTLAVLALFPVLVGWALAFVAGLTLLVLAHAN